MNEKIVNVYKFESEKGIHSYIYSLKKQDDFLGFDYYILTKNNDKPIIYEATNTIEILQSNNVNLIPIDKKDKEFTIFLKELLTVINNTQKKEEIPSRK